MGGDAVLLVGYTASAPHGFAYIDVGGEGESMEAKLGERLFWDEESEEVECEEAY
jgi:hypothetical protein